MAVRLPRTLADAAHLKPGSSVDVQSHGGRIVLTAVPVKKYRLADLLKGMTRKHRHPLLLDDPPRGREIW